MSEKKTHINIVRHIVLMWFVLFSLSPCTVKEALYHSVTVEYAKPPNKSKTTAQTSPCSYPLNASQQISVIKKSKISKHDGPSEFFNGQHVEILSAKTYNHYSKTSSGNSPPKYILYKRLKIDTV